MTWNALMNYGTYRSGINLNNVTDSVYGSMMTRVVKAIMANRELIQTITMASFVILFSVFAVSMPNYEWDLLPYIANATNLLTGTPVEALHGPIYENLKQSIPPDSYAEMTGSPSRLVLSQDPEAFRQTTAFFYDARIVYIHLLAGLIKLGLNPVTAAYVLSTACSVGSIVLLSKLIPVKAPLSLSFAIPFIALSCGLMTVARMATPDSLATLVTIALYFLLIRNRVALLLILLPLTIFIRSDLIVLTGLFYLYFFITNRISKIAIIGSAVATVAAYLVLNNFIIEADAWSSLIGYNFGDKPTHPQEYVFEVTLSGYFSYLLQGLQSFSYTPIFFVFCMLAVTGIAQFSSSYFYAKDSSEVSVQHGDILFLLVSCVAYYVLHFLLFPMTWTRFFAAQYSLVAVVVIWATMAILAERNNSTRDNMGLLDP